MSAAIVYTFDVPATVDHRSCSNQDSDVRRSIGRWFSGTFALSPGSTVTIVRAEGTAILGRARETPIG